MVDWLRVCSIRGRDPALHRGEFDFAALPRAPSLTFTPLARLTRHFCFPEQSIYLTSSGNGPSPAFPLLASSPSYTLGQIPDNLDQVVSGNVIDSIVGLFFDYVYPLTPCLHRPTFISNLTNRLDKTDPVFFALTLTVLASTLVQVPRSLVNLDKGEVENLARRCVRVARAKIAYIWEESVPVQSSFGESLTNMRTVPSASRGE